MANYQNLKASSQLSGGNAAYVEALYEQYLDAPDSVSPQWRRYFDEVRAGGADERPRLPVQERFEALAQGAGCGFSLAWPDRCRFGSFF